MARKYGRGRVSDETPTPDEPEVSVPTRRSGGRIAPDGTWLPATDEPPATAETLVVDRPEELGEDDVDDAPEPLEAVALVPVDYPSAPVQRSFACSWSG